MHDWIGLDVHSMDVYKQKTFLSCIKKAESPMCSIMCGHPDDTLHHAVTMQTWPRSSCPR